MNTLSQATIQRAQELAEHITQLREPLYCSESDMTASEREQQQIAIDIAVSSLVFVLNHNSG